MIVTCPACDTRYEVPDGQLSGSTGRQVRCANCGNLWRYTPEGAAIHAAIAETAANRERTASVVPILPATSRLVAERDPPLPPRAAPAEVLTPPIAEPATAPPTTPPPLTRPSVAVETPVTPPRRRRHIAQFIVVFLVAFIALGIIFARDRIAQVLPAVTSLLAKVNLSESPTAGLTVTVSASRNGDALTIDGDVANGASAARRIPRLRVTLRNGNKDEVDSKDIDPPVAQLPPGAKAHFTTVFDHPNAAATSVAAAFIGE